MIAAQQFTENDLVTADSQLVLTFTLTFAQSLHRLHHSPHEDIRGLDSFPCGRGASLVLGTIGHIHLRHLHHRHHMGGEKE